MVAGLLFKPEIINNIYDWLLYIKKIIIRYAKPYALYNILFLCFYNLFVKYHIIISDFRYEGMAHALTLNEFLHKALMHLLVLSRSELLAGSSWFLKSLFWGLFTFSIIILLYNNTFI